MVSQSDKQQLVKISERVHKLHIDFLKHILLLASTLFGVLIALHKQDNSINNILLLLWPVALSAIAVGILFGSIALYGEIQGLKLLQKRWAEELRNSLRENREPVMISVPAIKFYVVVETIAYVSFVLSVILLVSYSFLVVA
jgi:hypothetical protein